jgi:regulator of protease activity HflC (stomatin/prohibitin superfamily)
MRKILPFLALALPLAGCSASTEATEVGVRTVNFALFGQTGVMAEPYSQGATYFFPRWWSDFSVYDVGVQNLSMLRAQVEGDRQGDDAVRFKTVDGNDISVDVTIAWTIPPEKTPYVRQFVGKNTQEVGDKLVRPTSRTVVRDVLNQLTSEEFYQADKRSALTEEARARLNRVLEPEGVHVEQVLLGEHKFNPQYEQTIGDKKVAEQEASRLLSETEAAGEEMKRDLEKAKGEVSKQIETARGEAEKRHLEADAIYFEKDKQAEAILAEKKAHAEGLLAQAKAMSGAGGRSMVKMQVADALAGKTLVFVPSGGMDLRTTDMNTLLSTYGVAAATDSTSANAGK